MTQASFEFTEACRDRHNKDDVQVNVRVPRALRNKFIDTCLRRGTKPTVIVRAMLLNYVSLPDVLESGADDE